MVAVLYKPVLDITQKAASSARPGEMKLRCEQQSHSHLFEESNIWAEERERKKEKRVPDCGDEKRG